MDFTLPDTLPTSHAELTDLAAQARSAFSALYDAHGANPTAEQLTELTTLAEAVETVETAAAQVQQDEAERVAAAADLAARLAPAPEPEAAPEPEPAPVEPAAEQTQSAAQPAAENTADPAPAESTTPAPAEEALVAAANTPQRRSFAGAGAAAGHNPADVAPQPSRELGFRMNPNAPLHQDGLVDIATVARSIDQMSGSFRSGGGIAKAHLDGAIGMTFASISREIPDELRATEQNIEDVLSHAADETRLDGGSLLAGAGWSAISEVIYDYLDVDDAADLLDLPEIGVARGGVKFPVEPDFSAVYAEAIGASTVGFDQTEAQNIADATKPFYTVPASTFAELRLDAIGLAIRTGILQAKGHPEEVEKYIKLALKAHAHRVSKYSINKVVAGSGAARVIPTTGTLGAAPALLNSAELAIEDVRSKHRIPSSTTVELVLPTWGKPLVRADLANRDGVHHDQVDDAYIDRCFAIRKARVQWVSDWQTSATGLPGVTGGILAFPSTIQFVAYPAGTWVRAVEDVIELGTVHDKASLEKNLQTALFTEDGIGVAKRGVESRLYTVATPVSGEVGARTVLPRV
ncbi:major capsid protein [Rhodococcus aetherivorans]